jgi:hypothetical protein
MRNTKFISETEEIDIDDIKYAWKETWLEEMCNMHCKKQHRATFIPYWMYPRMI